MKISFSPIPGKVWRWGRFHRAIVGRLYGVLCRTFLSGEARRGEGYFVFSVLPVILIQHTTIHSNRHLGSGIGMDSKQRHVLGTRIVGLILIIRSLLPYPGSESSVRA